MRYMKIKPQMNITGEPLTTKRTGARYGNKATIGNKPVAWVKSAKKEDFLTPEEFVEDVYGKPVDHIVFKE